MMQFNILELTAASNPADWHFDRRIGKEAFETTDAR